MTQVEARPVNFHRELAVAEGHYPEVVDDARRPVEYAFAPLFDSYVDLLSGPETRTQVVGVHTMQDIQVGRYKVQYETEAYDAREIAELRRTDLEHYLRVAIINGDLQIDPEIVSGRGVFSVASLVDAAVDSYFENGVETAYERMRQKMIHELRVVPYGDVIKGTTEPTLTQTFIDRVKELAPNLTTSALNLIKNGPVPHSQEVEVRYSSETETERMNTLDIPKQQIA